MRFPLSAILILFLCVCAWGQEGESVTSAPLGTEDVAASSATHDGYFAPEPPDVNYYGMVESAGSRPPAADQDKPKLPNPFTIPDCCKETASKEKVAAVDRADDSDAIGPKERFHWKSALTQSLGFAAFQNVFRVAAQAKTRRELGGPFFRDWGRSVSSLRGWRDGDTFVTNYVGHPLQGAFTGRIFVNNSDRAKKQEFGSSKQYWESRMKAFVWSAVWSTQFELGPLSEATIGNVGMYKENGYNTMAYVDLVVTPVVGTGVLIGEDAIDKYFLKNWLEKKSSSKFKIKLLRSLVTPTISISNLVNGKVPWKRQNRPL